MKNEMIGNVIGVIFLYALLVFGVIAINARIEIMENNSEVVLSQN